MSLDHISHHHLKRWFGFSEIFPRKPWRAGWFTTGSRAAEGSI